MQLNTIEATQREADTTKDMQMHSLKFELETSRRECKQFQTQAHDLQKELLVFLPLCCCPCQHLFGMSAFYFRGVLFNIGRCGKQHFIYSHLFAAIFPMILPMIHTQEVRSCKVPLPHVYCHAVYPCSCTRDVK